MFPAPGSGFFYLDCNGVTQTIFVKNHKSQTVCCAQTSPGHPVSITPNNPSKSAVVYAGPCAGPGSRGLITGYGTLIGDPCSTSGTVYISATYTDIAPGVTVYENAAMTIVFTGLNYIKDQGGQIYNIDSTTGVVGTSTGTSC
jgi:hypothetical protein